MDPLMSINLLICGIAKLKVVILIFVTMCYNARSFGCQRWNASYKGLLRTTQDQSITPETNL
jgi:hypothetical protein